MQPLSQYPQRVPTDGRTALVGLPSHRHCRFHKPLSSGSAGIWGRVQQDLLLLHLPLLVLRGVEEGAVPQVANKMVK